MRRVRCIASVLLILVMPLLYGCGGESSDQPPTGKTTVLVYMVGSNLESDGNLGTENIEEMKAIGSSDKVKVILTTGGADKDGWKTVKRHEVLKGDLRTLDDRGAISMGDPETLKDFIVWGMNAYKADRYVLVLWDHGGGAIGGFGSDEVHDDDTLTLPKLRTALAGAYARTGKKLELVGFDACLMANTETAFNIREYARYLAASEDLEPGEGWDYTAILRYMTVNPGKTDGASLGKVIADSFKEKIDFNYNGKAAITFSVINLELLTSTFDTALKAFSDKIKENLSRGRDGWVEVAYARSLSYDFATSRIARRFCDMVDLKDMALNMKPYAPKETEKLLAAMEKAVVYKVHTLRPKAYGLTIYFPTGSIKSESYNKNYQSQLFVDSYKAMIARHVEIGTQDVSPPVFSGETKAGNRFSAAVAGDDIESVSAFISRTDASGKILMLGLTPVETGADDVATMEWTGKWLSLNGVTVSAYVEVPGDTSETLSIPVLLNDEAALLIVTRDKATGAMNIDGVWPGLDIKDYMAARTLVPLKAGDRIAPGFQVYDVDNKTIDIEFEDAFTLASPITLAETPLASGVYSVAFYATDLAFNDGWSSSVMFTAGKAISTGMPVKTDAAFATAVSQMLHGHRIP